MEITIIIIVCAAQFLLFGLNCIKLLRFKNIFPTSKKLTVNVAGGFVQGIESGHGNSIFRVIISSINKYLANNKGQVSDYHLIKDIVDRNTDAKEDEINTQIPMPLYLGLVGTMGCILAGLIKLDLSSVVKDEMAMIDGVSPLLYGVAVAMITSITGIACTTIGSYFAKNSKAKVEKNKNTFLSWMQAELLPQLSNDTASVLRKMTQELSNFNNTFAQNNAQFTNSLAGIADTSKKQTELIQLISQLQNKKITQNNLALLGKLIEVSNQMGTLGDNLQNVNIYTHSLHQIIREVSDYFKAEREQIEHRKEAFSNTLDEISRVIVQKLPETFNMADLKVRDALKEFNDNFVLSLSIIKESLDVQALSINEAVYNQQLELATVLSQQKEELSLYFATLFSQMQTTANEQQAIFKEKLAETTVLVDELRSISAVKSSLEKLVVQTTSQSQQISQFGEAIKKLAEKKVLPISIPLWVKIAGCVIGGIVGLAGLAVIMYGIFVLQGKTF